MSIVILAAAALYLCRLGGFVLPSIRSGSTALRFVPVAVFTALTLSPLLKNADFMPAKLIALLVAGVVVWRTRQIGVAVLVGFAVLKLLRLLV
jgi:branched-subunit amino acid transport protein